MNPPVNAELFESPLATFWFEDGILYSYGKGLERTIENLTQNFALVRRITQGQKACCLSFLNTSGTYRDKAAREFLERELADTCKAIAFVSDTPMGKMNGNILVVVGHELPKKFFTSPDEAHAWLKQFI